MDEIDDIMNEEAAGQEADDSASTTASLEKEAGADTSQDDDPEDAGDEKSGAAEGGEGDTGVEHQGIELDDFTADPADETASSQDASQANGASEDSEAGDTEGRGATDLHAVFDVPVQISAVLGHTEINVSDMLQLDTGAIIELDRKIGEAIDIYVNNRLVARGEVVVVENRLGITMTEIIKQDSA